MKNLILSTLRTALIGLVVLGLILFLPAGTLAYWQAWVFIIVFAFCTNYIGVYLMLKDPELLERRKQFGPANEQRTSQKVIMALNLVAILGMLVFCAFSHRFGWSPVPPVVALFGDFLVALGLYITLRVMMVNSFSASNIRTEQGQDVISTGPYALVRHPMYTGALIMVIGVPLALDAWMGLVIIAVTMSVLVWRILDEEKMLEKELTGYGAYEKKVRYRLVPYLW